ncbi:hypothetical protein EJB05_02614, partial [Eragrostis curvula]
MAQGGERRRRGDLRVGLLLPLDSFPILFRPLFLLQFDLGWEEQSSRRIQPWACRSHPRAPAGFSRALRRRKDDWGQKKKRQRCPAASAAPPRQHLHLLPTFSSPTRSDQVSGIATSYRPAVRRSDGSPPLRRPPPDYSKTGKDESNNS